MVSIIIPSFNAEKYIAETVLSVINQSYQDWELIIIDDGSTDNSVDIIKNLCIKDDRIKYHYQENSGVSVARNKGVEIATGKYVFFLDADDLWRDDNLKVKIDFFFQNKNVDWIFGCVELINEFGEKLNQEVRGNDSSILDSLLLWDGNTITAPSTIAIKKECAYNISFDENFSTAADQDFVIQLASKFTGGYFNQPSVSYRVVADSMSRNIALMEKDHIAVYQKASKNKLFKNFWFEQKCYSNLYWILAGSWWKNGDSKVNGFYFILKAIFANPLSIKFLFSKIF